MNNSKSEYIKRYSVKIKSPFGKEGSGILIKVDDNRCFLATAKHNFTQSAREESWKDVDETVLKSKLSDIQVLKQTKNICTLVDILYSYKDLIVFSIKNYEKHLGQLDKINILYESSYGDEYEYFFHGYPVADKKGDDGFIDELRSRNDSEKNKYLYDISSSKPLRQVSLKGFSGSGVFIKDGAKYYLVGIVLQRSDGLSSFTVFNLPKYLNDKKSVNIPLEKYVVNLENLDAMYSLILKRNPTNFLVQEHNEILGREYDYRQILQDTKGLKKIALRLKYTNRLYELEARYKRELADMYLLGTVLSEKCGDEMSSKAYFEKARKYEPTYIKYLKDIDIIYSKEELMREAKISFVDNKYTEAKLTFRRVLHLFIDDSDRIYIYKKLIDIAKIQNNKEEIINGYRELIDLYTDEDKTAQAEIFYELSLLEDNKSHKMNLLEKGLVLIAKENLDEIIEIKYKLKKEQNKLIGRNDIYFSLKPILSTLSRDNPKYRDEFKELILRDKYKFGWEQLAKRINTQDKWIWRLIALFPIIMSMIYITKYEPLYSVLIKFFSSLR